MPKLGFLIVCEKAILEEGTRTPTLVALFTGLRLTVPSLPPGNAAIPKDWAVICGWDSTNDETGRQYVQHTEVLWPDGTQFVRGEMQLMFEPGKRHYSVVRFLPFPVGQAGKCEIRVWLEFEGSPVTDKSSTHVTVEHEIKAMS